MSIKLNYCSVCEEYSPTSFCLVNMNHEVGVITLDKCPHQWMEWNGVSYKECELCGFIDDDETTKEAAVVESTISELKTQLAESEERFAKASLELTEIAYLIGGHGTTLSQAKWLMGEYRQLKKENEELKRLVAPL